MSSRRTVPHWTDGEQPLQLCRDIEEQLDERATAKTLAQCGLPFGLRLMYPIPKQMMVEGQVRWAFVLAWCPTGKDLYFYAQRYEQSVSDEIQMEWAVTDFLNELYAAGVETRSKLLKAEA